jgi:hypothetical protein
MSYQSVSSTPEAVFEAFSSRVQVQGALDAQNHLPGNDTAEHLLGMPKARFGKEPKRPFKSD